MKCGGVNLSWIHNIARRWKWNSWKNCVFFYKSIIIFEDYFLIVGQFLNFFSKSFFIILKFIYKIKNTSYSTLFTDATNDSSIFKITKKSLTHIIFFNRRNNKFISINDDIKIFIITKNNTIRIIKLIIRITKFLRIDYFEL